jgi:hypothetical protein
MILNGDGEALSPTVTLRILILAGYAPLRAMISRD